ncbi:MAG TPA: hypothetical protein VGK33_08705 [Chloroflexota bacterium]
MSGLTLGAGLLLHEPSHGDTAAPHAVRPGRHVEKARCQVLARRLVFRHRERALQLRLGLQPEVGFRALAVRHRVLTCGCH